MERLKKVFYKYKETVMYIIFGGFTSIISWGSYALFVYLFRLLVQPISIFGFSFSLLVLLSNSLSWLCATLFAYITNKIWVFDSKDWSIKIVIVEVVKFFSTRLAMGIFEVISVPILVAVGIDQAWFGIDGILAKLIVSIIGVVINYFISKIIVFKKKQNKKLK